MLNLEVLFQTSNIQAEQLEVQGKHFQAIVICTRKLIAD
jgi:hypothetical protein